MPYHTSTENCGSLDDVVRRPAAPKPMSVAETVKLIEEGRGSQFDPEVTDASVPIRCAITVKAMVSRGTDRRACRDRVQRSTATSNDNLDLQQRPKVRAKVEPTRGGCDERSRQSCGARGDRVAADQWWYERVSGMLGDDPLRTKTRIRPIGGRPPRVR